MLKVMIVEDNVLLADIVEDYLIGLSYEVCGIARSVAEAVALADQHTPDLAVMDYRLSNGELGSKIRSLVQGGDQMGILFVSGDTLADRLTSREGDAFMQKPYSMAELAKALSRPASQSWSRPFPGRLDC
jgi:DNA-binding response OmpR family regulator